MEVILLSIILKCNAPIGRCTFFVSLPLPHHSPKTFFINFLEVPKEKRIFAAIVPKVECTTFLDCWIYNLKHMETLEKMPFEAQHKIFKRLAEIADSKSLTKEEQEKYDNSMMVMWDNYAVYKHAEEKGIVKGEKKKSREFALKLLAHNYPLDEIANLTDLSIDEIKKLKQYN